MVGVGSYVTWPPEALELPRLGGLFDPNLERVVDLEPDLAILLPSQSEVAADLERAGVPTLTVAVESVEDVVRAVRAVAERAGTPEAGRELAVRLEGELAPRPLPEGAAPPRMALSLDRFPGETDDLLVAGPGTYLHELLTRLGAENVFAHARMRYPQVGVEAVLAEAPEAIVEVRSDQLAPEANARLVEDWRRYPSLPAVEEDHLYVIAESYAMVPGPRLPLLYDRLEEVVRRAAGVAEGGGSRGAEQGAEDGSEDPPEAPG